MNVSPEIETLYYLQMTVAGVWLILVGPAHGLLFAQIPPRLGACRLRWTEAVAFGLACLFVLLFLHMICFIPLYFGALASPMTIKLYSLLAFTLTTLLFGFPYSHVFSVYYPKACAFAFAQAIVFLALFGLLRMFNELSAFLVQSV